MGGFEPPLDRLSTCCLYRDWATWSVNNGPSGWTRTTTARVKSPACCIHITKGMNLERTTGLEPVPQGLEGPRATVTPRPHWFGLRDSNPFLHVGDVGCCLHTQAEWTSSVVKEPRSFRAGGQQGIRTQTLPLGERGYGPSADHPLVLPFLATVPGFEPGPASFGDSDAPVTPRCRTRITLSRHTAPVVPCNLIAHRGKIR